MKEPLPITACIRNSGFSGKSKVSVFNKSQRHTESEVLFSPLLLIHANRYWLVAARFNQLLKKMRHEKT